MIKPYLLLLIWIQSYGNIQSSSFGLTVKIFGLMVFVYSVVQFPSNDPFSFCSTSGLKASWVCQMQSPLPSAQNFEEEETQKKNCTRLKVRCQQRFQSVISGLDFRTDVHRSKIKNQYQSCSCFSQVRSIARAEHTQAIKN